MSWINVSGKKGENLLDNQYQNHENEKPVHTLLTLKPEAKMSDVFQPAPKKW